MLVHRYSLGTMQGPGFSDLTLKGVRSSVSAPQRKLLEKVFGSYDNPKTLILKP